MYRPLHGLEIAVAVVDLEHLPPVGLEPLAHVLGEGAVGAAVDANAVVVPDDDQPA